MAGNTPIPWKDRFWPKVKITDSCWEWIAGRMANGYGFIGAGGGGNGNLLAHRASYELHYGEITSGMCVLHVCDNRSCVRPDHLFLGTQADNMHDMKNKNRQAFGETAGGSKLKTQDVLEIRRLHSIGVVQKEIAKSFNVTPANINKIIKRVSWHHLPA